VIVPARLRLPAALGGAVLDVELELELPAGVPRRNDDLLSDAELRSRWRCSGRTLARMRAAGELPFLQPTPRRFCYRRADVERLEVANGARRHAPRRPTR